MQIGNFNFSIIELRFEKVDKDYKFFGSYYRGMLGRYLRRRFCILKNAECSTCPLNDKCLYMLAFEKYEGVLFPPYVINRAERNRLRLVLIGSFSDFSDVYLEAFERRLKVQEAGYFNPFYNEIVRQRVIVNSREIAHLTVDLDSAAIDISFLRIKKNSKMVPCEALNFEDILRATEKRIYLVNKFYGDTTHKVFLPPFGGDAFKVSCDYFKVKRYSNRKKRAMEIPSINCSFKIKGNLGAIYPYLYLASLLNIGTNASMGFGQVRLNLQTG